MDPVLKLLWSRFPADAQPRPLVLTGPRVYISGGFMSGRAKEAASAGMVGTRVDLPPGLLSTLVASLDGGLVPLPSRPLEPLQVVGWSAVVADFGSDRGPVSLPARRVEMSGLDGACFVLDPTVEVWWPPDDASGADARSWAVLDPDDVSLHVAVTGGVRTESVSVVFEEYDNFVIATTAVHDRPRTPGVITPAKGIGMTAHGHLTRPLGGRVLVDETGAPCVVLPTDARA